MLAGLQGMLALLAGLAVAGSGMPQPAAGVLVVFCMAWGVWCLLRSRRKHCASERKGLRYQRNTGWELWQPGTGWQPVRVLAGSLVTRHLVVLHLAGVGRRTMRLPVPADVLDADSHRRLRASLRLIPLAERVAGSSPALPAEVRDSPK